MNAHTNLAQKERPVDAGPLSSLARVSPEAETSQFAPETWSEPMGLSYPKYGYICTPPTTVTNQEVANEFAPLISDCSREEAAAASGRTIEAVKKWRARVQAPDSASLINAAASRPRIRAWLMWRIGGEPVLARSPQVMSELHQFLMTVGIGEGREAQEARRLYAEIFRPSAGNEASARVSGETRSVHASEAPQQSDDSLEAGSTQLSRAPGSFREAVK